MHSFEPKMCESIRTAIFLTNSDDFKNWSALKVLRKIEKTSNFGQVSHFLKEAGNLILT